MVKLYLSFHKFFFHLNTLFNVNGKATLCSNVELELELEPGVNKRLIGG